YGGSGGAASFSSYSPFAQGAQTARRDRGRSSPPLGTVRVGFWGPDDAGATGGSRTGETSHHEPHRYRSGTQATGQTHPWLGRQAASSDSRHSPWGASAAGWPTAQNRVPGQPPR